MSRIILALLLLTGILGCNAELSSTRSANSPAQNQVLSDDNVSQEEFTIYDLVINSSYSRNSTQLLVIQEETALGNIKDHSLAEQLKYVGDKLPQIEQSVLREFSGKNSKSYKLSDNFNLKVKHILAGSNVLDPMLQLPSFWREFYNKFPDAQGMLSLSRVAFNSEVNQALVYVATASGPDTGGSYYVFLTKKSDEWTILYNVKVSSV